MITLKKQNGEVFAAISDEYNNSIFLEKLEEAVRVEFEPTELNIGTMPHIDYIDWGDECEVVCEIRDHNDFWWDETITVTKVVSY